MFSHIGFSSISAYCMNSKTMVFVQNCPFSIINGLHSFFNENKQVNVPEKIQLLNVNLQICRPPFSFLLYFIP